MRLAFWRPAELADQRLPAEVIAAFKTQVPVSPWDVVPGQPAQMTTVWEQRACPHCGGVHTKVSCPRVKEIEYHENTLLKRVVYWPDGEWDDSGTIWNYALGQPAEPTEAVGG